MPKRIVNSPVQVVRDGQFTFPPVGKVFEFTDDELKQINASNPKALERIIVADEPKVEPAPQKAAKG